MNILKPLIASLLLLQGTITLRAQQAPPPLTTASKTEVVQELSKSLLSNYIFLDTAQRMANYVQQQLKTGKYNRITNAGDFAQTLMSDLRSVYNDQHLSISYNPPLAKDLADTTHKDNPQDQVNEGRQQNFGLKKAEVLNGNVGYIALNSFWDPTDEAKQTVQGMFSFLKNTNALIVDLRNNGGGSPDMVQYLCSFFLAPGTHINDLYERRLNKTTTYATLPTDSSKHFASIPVYVLVNGRTFSAAEEFSYDLQNQHRAKIVGEVTGGGAHPVAPSPIGNGFIANIPFARAVSPVTHTNWEAVGVKPDMAVKTSNALDVALLDYFDGQMAAKNESILWARTLLMAKVHPVSVDTSILKNYTGTFGARVFSYSNGALHAQSKDGSISKLIPLSDTEFKLEDLDYLTLRFSKNDAGKVDEVVYTFEDGFIRKERKKE